MEYQLLHLVVRASTFGFCLVVTLHLLRKLQLYPMWLIMTGVILTLFSLITTLLAGLGIL